MGRPPAVMVLPTKSHFLGSISHLKVIGVACGVWIVSWFTFLLLNSTGLLGRSGYAAWVGLKAALPVIVLVFSYAIDCRGLACRLPLRVLLHATYWLALGLVTWISLEGARASAAPEDAGGEAVVIDIICLFAFAGYAAIDGLRGLIVTVSRGSEDPPYAYDHGAGLATVRALLRSRARLSTGQPAGPANGGQPLSSDSIICSHTKTRRHEGLEICEPRIERMTRISWDTDWDQHKHLRSE